jgi:hypothetical protein
MVRPMSTHSLADLRRPDRIWRSMGPFFGYSSDPEACVAQLNELVASAVLSQEVPERLREQFAVARKLFLHGFFEYGFFWVAAAQGYLIAETALRERFLQYYAGNVPFVWSDGSRSETVNVGHFEQLWDLLRGRLRPRDWKLASVRSSQPHDGFDGNFTSLLRWAFDEQLLPGRKGTHIGRVFTERRNMAGHPSYGREPPTGPARELCDVAEFINCLWGQRAGDGRLFPVPGRIQRVPVAVVRDRQRGSVSFGGVATLSHSDDLNAEAEVTIVQAAIDDNLASFRDGFESTSYPATKIWGPGSPRDALDFLAANPVPDDEVTFADRLFVIRTGRDLHAEIGPFDKRVEGVELPRSPAVAAMLPGPLHAGKWYVLQADFPDDAFMHVVEHRKALGRHRIRRPPRCSCGVDELIAAASWKVAMETAATVAATNAAHRTVAANGG